MIIKTLSVVEERYNPFAIFFHNYYFCGIGLFNLHMNMIIMAYGPATMKPYFVAC